MDGPSTDFPLDELPPAEEVAPSLEEELRYVLKAEISDAVQYRDELEEDRAKARGYYDLSHSDLEPEEGRSSVHSSDLRDTITMLMPSLMRVFFAGDRVAEYEALSPEAEETARQATDFVENVVLRQDNEGYVVLQTAIMDCLLERTGIVKWWWEEEKATEDVEFEGLDLAEVDALSLDPELEIGSVEKSEEDPGLFDVKAVRRSKVGKVRVEAVPPNEFLISRRARSLTDASLVAHQRSLTAAEVVEITGLDLDEVLEFAGTGDEADVAPGADQTRRNAFAPDRNDAASRSVLYTEAYVLFDEDGDGRYELLRVIALGQNYEPVFTRRVSHRPFALFWSDLDPHSAVGRNYAERLMDIQRVKTQVMRDVMDSLAEAVIPREYYVEGRVDIDALLNRELGNPVGMDAPGMVEVHKTPFVGPDALPVLEYWDSVRENRTGVTKASMGLNAEALQSSTLAAVNATIQAAQATTEHLVRNLAESGVKDLYRGLFRMLVEHSNRAREVKLRGEWVAVDPRSWNTAIGVRVHVAPSKASDQEKLATLEQIAQRQEAILQQYGPGNPLVTVSQYRNTLAKIVELGGFRNPSQFFKEIPPEVELQLQQLPPPQQADPASAVAEAEVQKEQIRAQLKMLELQMKDNLERDRIIANVMIEAEKIRAQFNKDVNVAAIQAAMKANDKPAGETNSGG